MKVLRGISGLNYSLVHPVLTIGNFDGVHLGHQKIIGLAVEKAKARNGQSVTFTFRPHPQVALRPHLQLQLLSTYDEKLEQLEKLGVDLVIEEPFSREFSSTGPEQFFTEVLLKRLGAEAIVVGYDFAFGRERNGHLEVLEALSKAAGVELTIVPPQRMGSDVVSSSKIRQNLLGGNVEQAGRLLGRPFSYRGVVIKGDARGRTLGFPTANLKIEDKLVISHGVYATRVLLEGKIFPSVTNVGIRPTFEMEGTAPHILVETHLLNQNIDLYGRTLEVQFISKIRNEEKFQNLNELRAQIQRDIEEASQRLISNPL